MSSSKQQMKAEDFLGFLSELIEEATKSTAIAEADLKELAEAIAKLKQEFIAGADTLSDAQLSDLDARLSAREMQYGLTQRHASTLNYRNELLNQLFAVARLAYMSGHYRLLAHQSLAKFEEAYRDNKKMSKFITMLQKLVQKFSRLTMEEASASIYTFRELQRDSAIADQQMSQLQHTTNSREKARRLREEEQARTASIPTVSAPTTSTTTASTQNTHKA